MNAKKNNFRKRVVGALLAITTFFNAMGQTAQIADFVFLPGEKMFENSNLQSTKFDAVRVGGVVFAPYLIHIGHTTRRLEIVGYSDKIPLLPVTVSKVRFAGLRIEDERRMVFRHHTRHSCFWARVAVVGSIEDSALKPHETKNGLVLEATVQVGDQKKKLSFALTRRVRVYEVPLPQNAGAKK